MQRSSQTARGASKAHMHKNTNHKFDILRFYYPVFWAPFCSHLCLLFHFLVFCRLLSHSLRFVHFIFWPWKICIEPFVLHHCRSTQPHIVISIFFYWNRNIWLQLVDPNWRKSMQNCNMQTEYVTNARIASIQTFISLLVFLLSLNRMYTFARISILQCTNYCTCWGNAQHLHQPL